MWWLLACSGVKPPGPAGDDTADTAGETAAETGASTGGETEDTIPVDTSNHETEESGTGNGGESGDTEDSTPPEPEALWPQAPDADHFAWQGLQDRLRRDDGTECASAVAVGVGEHAVCYAGADARLYCAGTVYGQASSSRFYHTGQGEATQVFVSPAVDGVEGSSVCALIGGRLTCVGNYNGFGQLGNGTTSATSTWIAGSRADLQRVATGAWDQLCGVDGAGMTWCAGYSYGATPVEVGEATTLWIEVDGTLKRDDSRTWRASPARTEAWLRSSGLDSDNITARYGLLTGTKGLVDVVVKQRFPDGVNSSWTDELCTLSPDATVACTHLDPSNGLGVTESRFAGVRVVSIAASYESSTLCAVSDLGALWCLGENGRGQLGVGSNTYVATETEVAPAGSVRVGCDG